MKRVALITGGSRGIGAAICRELASHDYYVAINYRSGESAAAAVLEAIEAAGGQGELLGFDVTDRQAAEAAVEDLVARHERLDVLVNNAGIVRDGLFAMMEPEAWDQVLATSLDGFYNLTRPATKRMIRQRGGAVVSLSSVAALLPNRGQVNYAAAKAGLVAASRSLAAEVGRLGIRVNVVAPGLIDTEMINNVPTDNVKQLIPMGRVGRPEEVAPVVRFLCSDDASYVSGAVVTVSGGMA